MPSTRREGRKAAMRAFVLTLVLAAAPATPAGDMTSTRLTAILFSIQFQYELLLFETQADVVDNCFILVSPDMVGDYCWLDDGSGV